MEEEAPDPFPLLDLPDELILKILAECYWGNYKVRLGGANRRLRALCRRHARDLFAGHNWRLIINEQRATSLRAWARGRRLHNGDETHQDHPAAAAFKAAQLALGRDPEYHDDRIEPEPDATLSWEGFREDVPDWLPTLMPGLRSLRLECTDHVWTNMDRLEALTALTALSCVNRSPTFDMLQSELPDLAALRRLYLVRLEVKMREAAIRTGEPGGNTKILIKLRLGLRTYVLKSAPRP
jgi:hypothetical protein